jgi:hypothetical protein
MSDAVLIALVNTAGIIVVAVLGGKKLVRIGRDAAVTREQAENEHADAEYPNLRDELTATRAVADRAVAASEAASAEAKAAKGATHGLTRQVNRLVTWLEDLSSGTESTDEALARIRAGAARALERAGEKHDAQLADLRDEIPDIIRTELSQHVADCPLRTPRTTT